MEHARLIGIKNILHLGSWEDDIMSRESFTKVSKDRNSLMKFANNLKEAMLFYKMDGVYISWFWPGCNSVF